MHTVLLVENEVILALDLADTLCELGYDVIGPAMTAEAACRMAREQRPDVILMDIRLNGERDGIDAAAEITAQSGIKVIFLSSEDDNRTRQRAEQVHPFAWLQKPCPSTLIRQTLADALAA